MFGLRFPYRALLMSSSSPRETIDVIDLRLRVAADPVVQVIRRNQQDIGPGRVRFLKNLSVRFNDRETREKNEE